MPQTLCSMASSQNAIYPENYKSSLNTAWDAIKTKLDGNPNQPQTITIPKPTIDTTQCLMYTQDDMDYINNQKINYIKSNYPNASFANTEPTNSSNTPSITSHPVQFSVDPNINDSLHLDDMIQAENSRLDAKEQSYQNMQFGKKRVLELNQNFQERTSFFNGILFVLFMTFILTVICLYLGNTFPDYGFIFSGMMFLILISGVGYAVYLYLSFLKRNPMNFDEIQYLKSPSEIKADNASKKTEKTGDDLLNTSYINTTYCTGPECCDTKDMKWDAGNNICVDNGPNYIYGMTTPGTISGSVGTTSPSSSTPSSSTPSSSTPSSSTPSSSTPSDTTPSSSSTPSSSTPSDTTPPSTTATPPSTTAKPKKIPIPDLNKKDVYLDKTERNFVINVKHKNKFTLSILHVATVTYISKNTVDFYLDSANDPKVINADYFIYFEKDANNEPIPIPFRFSDFKSSVVVEVPNSENLTDYDPVKKIDYKTPGIKLTNISDSTINYYCYQSIENRPPKLIQGDEFISIVGANIKVSNADNFIVDTNGKSKGGLNLEFISFDGVSFNCVLNVNVLFIAKVISYHDSTNYKINGQAIEITPFMNNVENPPIVFTFNMNQIGSDTFTNMIQVENFESSLPSIQINQYKIYPTLKNKSSAEISTYQPKPSDSPFLEYKNFTNNLFSL